MTNNTETDEEREGERKSNVERKLRTTHKNKTMVSRYGGFLCFVPLSLFQRLRYPKLI